jgi:amphiphysin
MIQTRRQETGLSPGNGLSRSATASSSSLKKAPPPPPPGSASSSTFKKKPPPPPNGSSSAALKKAPPPPPPGSAAPPPPYTPGNGPAAAIAAATKRAPPPPPAAKPKPKPKPKPQPVYVVAMYDFAAQVRSALWQTQMLTGTKADGDLEFKTGDRIEVVSRTDSQEDWWTGKLDGRQGVFPGKRCGLVRQAPLLSLRRLTEPGVGNYVRDA